MIERERNSEDHVTALEFFSGIGGMHYGLLHAGLENLNVIPFDINPNANECYEFNFGRPVNQKSIEGITPEELDKLNARIWTMSPPCQPFTRTGKQMDHEDPRSAAFLHLIHVLPLLQKPPDFLFLENVEAFYNSVSHERLLTVLKELNFVCQEFIVSPTDLGIPNHRPRYFLCARRNVPFSSVTDSDESISGWEYEKIFSDNDPRSRLSFYLEKDLLWKDSKEYCIPDNRLKSSFPSTVLVGPDSTSTKCFTKAYAKFNFSSGSYLQTLRHDIDASSLQDPREAIETCGIRRLTPSEIARLHGFPFNASQHIFLNGNSDISFSFPPSMTINQQWKVLGNSLNVTVVGEMMKRVLFTNSYLDKPNTLAGR